MDLNLWKQRKKELHLNYDKIAEMTGLPKSTITNIFLGYVTAPRIDTVEAIERALGLGITSEEREAGATEKVKISLSPDEYELVMVYREIGTKHGKEAQRALITVSETML